MSKFCYKILAAATAVIATAVLLLSAAPECLAIPTKPSPERLVNDFAGIFSRKQAESLERTLVAFDDSTSNQITVVTVGDLEGYSAMEYATQTGLEWKVGSEKFDNGIVLLVKPKTSGSNGQVAISVGYGLEGAVTDAHSKRIIETVIIPRFRENDYFGGVAEACSLLMKLASGEISELREKEDDVSGIMPALIAFGISGFAAMVLIIIIFGKGGRGNNSGRRGGGYHDDSDDILRGIILGSMMGSGRRSGSFGNFGGSSGFGGGFGGFGGGSFGGGGASGSW